MYSGRYTCVVLPNSNTCSFVYTLLVHALDKLVVYASYVRGASSYIRQVSWHTQEASVVTQGVTQPVSPTRSFCNGVICSPIEHRCGIT